MKYTDKNGNDVEILRTNLRGDYPIIILVHRESDDRVEFYKSLNGLIAIKELEDLKVDDRVEVSNDGKEWVNRRFSHSENGKIFVFKFGESSKHNGGETITWDYWRLQND